ncbi:glycosyl hydrolase family 18 protein [Sedimentibacter sp. B4]|uniref:glycosyl hydrolase family 18 protein n=1 Tax=Sedimentibacter sp. B4 TaxID=304766 RepID=UPI0003114D42|nr:glycosyl hydrolase family 18 protein [Sedimentibacter sp. B4]
MKKMIILILAAVLLLNIYTCYGADDRFPNEKEFKVIGYYSGDLFNEPLEKLQTDKLTHVIYAFLIPKSDGTLEELKKPEQLLELVDKAHRDGAKVFVALGGWSYEGKVLEPVFKESCADDEIRKNLVENVIAFTEQYNLDGVEVDWEHPNKDTIASYEKLVVELSQGLKLKNKELTAALNGAWSVTGSPETSKLITKNCLDSFSFINVMAYDINNDNHSPFWFSETSIDYWLNRGVKSEDIVLGMPLYAHPSWMQYRHLVELDSNYAYVDYAPTSPLGSYYNGMNTLREKTKLAMFRAGGVMLFDVNEDASGQYSIVSMIDSMVKRYKTYSSDEKNKYITVVLDNREAEFSEEDGFGIPYINSDNRTMIPLRKTIEAIGAEVSFNQAEQTVTAIKNETTVTIPIGENYISVNGEKTLTDTCAEIISNRTYIPLRAVLTAFGRNVEYHQNSQTVIIN